MVLTFVMINGVILALMGRNQIGTLSTLEGGLNIGFTAIFICEAILKIYSFGFFNREDY